jgi:RNA polymerase sigma-70 factor (ECF subfamily)
MPPIVPSVAAAGARPAPHDAAAEKLIRGHLGMVLATCRRILGRADLAEDAAQEVFLQAFQTPPAHEDSLPAWLHRIAVNKAISLRRREHAHVARILRHAAGSIAVASGAATQKEAGAEIDETLDGLDESDRSLLIAHYLDGASQEQLAERLGLSQSAVSRRLHAALEAARARLRSRGVILDAMGVLACVGGCGAESPSARVQQRLLRAATRRTLGTVDASAASILALALAAVCACALMAMTGLHAESRSTAADDAPGDSGHASPIEDAIGSRAQRTVSLVLRREPVLYALAALNDALPLGEELDTRVSSQVDCRMCVTLQPHRKHTVEECLDAIAGACHGAWRSIRGHLVLMQPMTNEARARWLGDFELLSARLRGQDADPAQTEAIAPLMRALSEDLPRVPDDPAALQALLHAAFDHTQPRLRNAALSLCLTLYNNAMNGLVGERPMPAELPAAQDESDLDARIIDGLGPGSDTRTCAVAVWTAGMLGRTAAHAALVRLIQRAGPNAESVVLDGAYAALQTTAQPADAKSLEAIATATQNRDIATRCAEVLAAIGDAESWRFLESVCDPNRASPLVGGHLLGTARPLWSAPEAIARPFVQSALASWNGNEGRGLDPFTCLARWGHPSDAARLLATLPLRASVPRAFAHALGRLGDERTLARVTILLRQLPPKQAAALEAGTARLEGRKQDRDGVLLALARTLGAGLASCPDEGFWRECERRVDTESDPVAQTLAATALARSYRPLEAGALIATLASQQDPANEAILACAAGQLNLPAARTAMLAAVADRRLSAIERATIVNNARFQDAPLATVGLALRHDAGLAVPIWAHLHALPDDSRIIGQVASMIADRSVDGRVRGCALLLAAGRCGPDAAYAHDQDAFVRGCAIFRVAESGSTEAVALLLERLRHDPAAVVRRVAASGLGMQGGQQSPEVARELLAEVSGDSDLRTRILAARSLCAAVIQAKKPIHTEVVSALEADLLSTDEPALRDTISAVLSGSCDREQLDCYWWTQFNTGGNDEGVYSYSLQCCAPDPDQPVEASAPALGGAQG